MEFNVAPPRADHAAQANTPLLRAAAKPVAVRPETANPVTAAEPVSLPAPIKGLGIPPLDMFQVGDNDDIPVPPEPPRKPAVLAIMAPEAEPSPPEPDAKADGRPSPEPAEPRAEKAALPALLKQLDESPNAPKVDVRR